jgi:hypothetical protein
VSASGDTRVQAGDLIQIQVPAAAGFTAGDNEDKYLSGIYMVTDISHVIGMGGDYTIVMNLNKDSYESEIDQDQVFAPGTSVAITNPAREN